MLECGPAQGPNVLRLGGGGGNDSADSPAEFGNGAIVELVTWAEELSAEDVWAVSQHFEAAYPGLLV